MKSKTKESTKTLFKERHIEVEGGMDIEYYIVETKDDVSRIDSCLYGVEINISKTNTDSTVGEGGLGEFAVVYGISDNIEEILEIAQLLADNCATPVNLQYIVEDKCR